MCRVSVRYVFSEDISRVLLTCGANPTHQNLKNQIALHIAVENGNKEVIGVISKRCPGATNCMDSMLRYSQVLKYLIPRTPLLASVISGTFDLVEFLLVDGMQLLQYDRNRMSPLHFVPYHRTG